MEKNNHVKFEYNQITKNIYLGTNSCCATHLKKEFLEQGIHADISLENEKIDAPWGVKYFLWLPTMDHTAPSMESLVLGVQMMTFLIKQNKKIYIHCKNGHGRAPTLVAAYFVSMGMPVKKAIKTIMLKRKETHLDPIQEAMLKKFSKEIKW